MAGVALVGPSWPFRGGIARTTTALAAALARRGRLQRFVVPYRQYPRVLFPGAADVDDDACERLDRAEACFGVLEPWTWPAAVRRLGSGTPTAVALPYWTAAWAPFALAVQVAVRRPVVGIVHNPADHDAGRIARHAAGAVLARCDAFLCHAETVAARLRRSWPGRQVVVHPLPAVAETAPPRLEARARLGVPADAVAFLYFGLIRPYKGLEVLLEAFAGLPRERPAVLLVAGEPWGELAQVIPRQLEGEGLRDRVVAHLGWVPEREAPDWFAAADVAVLPYRAATGSAVAAQAMGYGLPVIGSAVGGLAEVVEDGDNGLLVPPGDAAALAAALERILDREALAALGRGAATAARRWSWDSYAGALLDVAGAVAGSSGAAAAAVSARSAGSAASTTRRGR